MTDQVVTTALQTNQFKSTRSSGAPRPMVEASFTSPKSEWSRRKLCQRLTTLCEAERHKTVLASKTSAFRHFNELHRSSSMAERKLVRPVLPVRKLSRKMDVVGSQEAFAPRGRSTLSPGLTRSSLTSSNKHRGTWYPDYAYCLCCMGRLWMVLIR